MSRDYKPSPERPKKVNKGSPFFTGLMIGFLLGVAASLGVVVLIKGGESPFTAMTQQTKPLADKILEEQKSQADAPAIADPSASTKDQSEAAIEKDDGTRFDFYNILPGSENKTATENPNVKDDATASTPSNIYDLQVGAFQTAEEADNMKATLALQGFEAVVQTAPNSDNGIWHRVRVGPLKNLDEINRIKADLLNNGFKADLVKEHH